MLSIATLKMLKQVLDGQQVSAGDPAFADLAAKIVKAQAELDEAIVEAEKG